MVTERHAACVKMQERINSADAAILQHLVNVSGSRFNKESGEECSCGYTVKFSFTPNAYFSETELSITALFSDEEESIVKGIEGTDISWSSDGVSFAVVTT